MRLELTDSLSCPKATSVVESKMGISERSTKGLPVTYLSQDGGMQRGETNPSLRRVATGGLGTITVAPPLQPVWL